jgi:hypothetical protein
MEIVGAVIPPVGRVARPTVNAVVTGLTATATYNEVR